MKCIYYILIKLDNDVRTDIFIGVLGILVAIAIFIAEVISNKKIEIYKNFILDKTKLKANIGLVILTLIAIWFGKIFNNTFNIFYILSQLIINAMIGISIVKTFEMFCNIIRLNTDKKYYDIQLDKYIEVKAKSYINRIKKRNIEFERANKELKECIKNNYKVIKLDTNMFNFIGEYKVIESNKNGYITSYDFSVLSEIENKMTPIASVNKNENCVSENNAEMEPVIYFCNVIGNECKEGQPIAYYKNIKPDVVSRVNEAVNVRKEKYDDEFFKLLDDIFEVENQDLFNINKENIVVNFYRNICQRNDYEDIIGDFIKKIYYWERECINNVDKNVACCKVLLDLSHVSILNDRYNDFKTINSYITALYMKRIELVNDPRSVAVRYANDGFLYYTYSMKNSFNYKYYDLNMSGLVSIIRKYLDMNDFESIIILFDNVYFRNEGKFDEEFTKWDKINFIFILVVIYLLLYKCEKGNSNETVIKNIENLIAILNNKFEKMEILSMWEAITMFYECRHYETCNVIDIIDFDEEKHKYKTAYLVRKYDFEQALKCFIFMFDIYDSELKEKEKSLIDKEDKYKYKDLLQKFDKTICEKLEQEYLWKSDYKEKLDSLLNEVIEIAEEKEKEYYMNADLDTERIMEFKNTVRKYSKEKSEIEILLNDLEKIKRSNEKLHDVFGTSQLIPRSWLVKDSNWCIENVAEEYGKAFTRGLEKEVIDYIKSIKSEEESLEKVLNKINQIDEYVLLTNRSFLRSIEYSENEKSIEKNGKEIKTVVVFQLENPILLNKNAFPNIEICKFEDKYNECDIEDDLYINIEDCLKREELRHEIIENNDWLKEKGSYDEMDSYLKTVCNLKMYKAYKIIKPRNPESYLIKI